MVAFSVGALGAALSGNLVAVLAARCLMALGAGIVTPVAVSVGVALAGAEGRDRALAVVFGGLTRAQALGVPIGSALGGATLQAAGFGLLGPVGAGLALLALVSLGWLRKS
jgi:predicted MFS family arabinose efflux permease